MLWGLDLGLTFTTWLNFSGVWVLFALALVVGEPMFGAALFAMYWLGRVLSVWIAPLLVTHAAETDRLLFAIQQHRGRLRSMHAAGLLISVFVLSVLTATSASV